MKFQIHFSEDAHDDLVSLDQIVAHRIVEKLKWFCNQSNPLSFAKRLNSSPYGEYRFRVGDYRILFDVDSRGRLTILVILRVRHRREVYD